MGSRNTIIQPKENETQPKEKDPNETQPNETKPKEKDPNETQPNETQPNETSGINMLIYFSHSSLTKRLPSPTFN